VSDLLDVYYRFLFSEAYAVFQHQAVTRNLLSMIIKDPNVGLWFFSCVVMICYSHSGLISRSVFKVLSVLGVRFH
jgi:hypothetical protein